MKFHLGMLIVILGVHYMTPFESFESVALIFLVSEVIAHVIGRTKADRSFDTLVEDREIIIQLNDKHDLVADDWLKLIHQCKQISEKFPERERINITVTTVGIYEDVAIEKYLQSFFALVDNEVEGAKVYLKFIDDTASKSRKKIDRNDSDVEALTALAVKMGLKIPSLIEIQDRYEIVDFDPSKHFRKSADMVVLYGPMNIYHSIPLMYGHIKLLIFFTGSFNSNNPTTGEDAKNEAIALKEIGLVDEVAFLDLSSRSKTANESGRAFFKQIPREFFVELGLEWLYDCLYPIPRGFLESQVKKACNVLELPFQRDLVERAVKGDKKASIALATMMGNAYEMQKKNGEKPDEYLKYSPDDGLHGSAVKAVLFGPAIEMCDVVIHVLLSNPEWWSIDSDHNIVFHVKKETVWRAVLQKYCTMHTVQ